VAEYAKAPGVTRDRMYLDTMQEIFSNTSKIMIDAKTATTIQLPLDRMLAQSDANAAAIGSRSGPMMAPPQLQTQPGQAQVQAQQPQQVQVQMPQQVQPQAQVQGQAVQQAPIQEAPRQRDLRSRDSSRERESR
jgi:membrane protease subunit HflK